jgi:hypothetical protein
VILLENSNKWNLSPAKEGSSKKKEKREKRREKEKKEQGLKSKRGETSYEEAPCFKMRKRGQNLQAAGRDSIERKNERRSHFPIV